MLRIAGKTAGLIGLIFFVDTHVKKFKKFNFFFKNSFKFIFSRATPALQLVSYKGFTMQYNNYLQFVSLMKKKPS